jgi:hypothetical protein
LAIFCEFVFEDKKIFYCVLNDPLFACGYPKNAEFYAHFKSVDFIEKGAAKKIICQKLLPNSNRSREATTSLHINGVYLSF